MKKITKLTKEKLKPYKKELVIWAAKCAEHVLPFFEKYYPNDKRPRKAIETAREWVKYIDDEKRKIKLLIIRKVSLDSHAVARKVSEKNISARYAARAAGQAVATCHATGHSLGTQYYALKAVGEENKTKERKWQMSQLPKKLRKFFF